MLLVLALLAAAATNLLAEVDKPNIVFIMVDDLGPEWVSAYGADDIETPRIDRLAAEGMLFENAYSMPQCTPTRATLLTGQYPFRHGWVNHWDVPRWGAGAHFDPQRNVAFARLLRDAGYATGVAGKWQINDFRVQPNVLREHGFDEWSMWTGYESGVPASAERYWEPYVYTNLTPSSTFEGKFGPDIYHRFVLDFLERHRREPMLLYYPMALTHGPLVATPDEPDATDKMARHKAMVRYVDRLVGEVVDKVDALGIRRRTVIFFTTDNGTSGGITGHLNGRAVPGGKAKLTENGPRQPFIVSAPGMIAEGVRTDALTDFSDMLPTFVELAGAELPSGVALDGRSIAPVLLGKDTDGPRDWILAMGHGPARLDDEGVRPVEDYANRVVRDKRWKVHVIDRRPAKFYDLASDPAEQHNLIDSAAPEHVAARRKLIRVVEGFPARDARPRYDPLPTQPWDITREANEKSWKRRRD